MHSTQLSHIVSSRVNTEPKGKHLLQTMVVLLSSPSSTPLHKDGSFITAADNNTSLSIQLFIAALIRQTQELRLVLIK